MRKANVTNQNQSLFRWNAIDWRTEHRRVNNLRQRIYKASIVGDLKRVRGLQKLMIRSQANRLTAIRRVTQVNQGRRTSGVDNVVITTDTQRATLLKSLATIDPSRVYPVKRVYIPKKNGKQRALGLPAIQDRCQQAIVKSALEPYWEAKFEGISYGFRPGRSAHDAIQKIFCIVRPGQTRYWVLDADIKGAFDTINHDYLMEIIGRFPGRAWIKAWLTAGVMENLIRQPTDQGTPQGGVVSPLLANIAFHGMEDALDVCYNRSDEIDKSSRYAIVRYADDFVIFAKTRIACEEAKAILERWLVARGLELSMEKTRIKHIDQGFDFLGFNIRRYRTAAKKRGVIILCKPSKESIQSFKKQIKDVWRTKLSCATQEVIKTLNPKLKGWANYFRVGTSKLTFSALDHWMWIRQSRFVARRHPKKDWGWRKRHYWGSIRSREDHWVFMDPKSGLYLWKLAWTPIKRHILVKLRASPDNPDLREYWQKRQARKSSAVSKTKRMIWRKQKGICLLCREGIDNGESVHVHHILPRSQNGNNGVNNLCMLHAGCHRQLHSRLGKAMEVHKLLEPYAG